MKLNKNSILIALVILILLIGIAKAEVPVFIGTALQPDPFESNPTASGTSGNFISSPTTTAVTTLPVVTPAAFVVTNPNNAKDQVLTSFAALALRTTSGAINDRGTFDVKGFEGDASTPAITQVDLRIRYVYTAGSPAANWQYNITADLGAGAASTLVANTGSSAALATYKWDNLAKPSGALPWTWVNIAALRIRFSEKRLATTAPNTAPTYRVHEVWIRVICAGKPILPDPVGAPATKAYDGKILGASCLFGGFRESTGYIAFSTFTQPSVDPTWVDFKVRYSYTATPDTGSTGDKYRITYYVGGTGPTVLQDWTNASYPGVVDDTLAQGWFNQPDTFSGGAWTAADVGSVEVRLETQIVGDEDMVAWTINEVWLSCYSSPLPPTGSTVMSIIPQVIPAMTSGDIFFVDIYVRDFVGIEGGLAGFQIQINCDPNEVNPAGTPTAGGGFSYWPWTSQDAYDFQPDYASMTYTIPTTNPIFTTGMPGTDFAIARVYFTVVATTTNYSPLTFSVSFIGDQGANKIAHAVYHAFYGAIPADTYLVGSDNLGRPSLPPPFNFPYTDPTSYDGKFNEQYPTITAGAWKLTGWTDTDTSLDLTTTDIVKMTPQPSGTEQAFTVNHIWGCDADPNTYVYMILTMKPAVPEFPFGIEALMALAPIIPIIYLWRKRPKRRVTRL